MNLKQNKFYFTKFMIFVSAIITWVFGFLLLGISFDLFGFLGIFLVILAGWKIWWLPFIVIAIADFVLNKNPTMLILCVILLPFCKFYFDYQLAKQLFKQQQKIQTEQEE